MSHRLFVVVGCGFFPVYGCWVVVVVVVFGGERSYGGCQGYHHGAFIQICFCLLQYTFSHTVCSIQLLVGHTHSTAS